MVAVQANLLNWDFFLILIYSITGIYSIVFLVFLIGWIKIKNPVSCTSKNTKVSILVAMRNETRNIPHLLNCLVQQSYPQHLMEIILVDDHSTIPVRDHEYFNAHPTSNISVIQLNSDEYGKKAALRAGANTSKADLLLFTDADCRFGSDWIKEHVKQYEQGKSKLNIGMVRYLPSKNWLSSFYKLDFSALVMTGAATAQLRHATLCNGANLSVDRKVYLELQQNLRMDIPSGDDVFLLHSVKKKYPDQISVLKSEDSLVQTAPPSTLREFLNQRVRWGSKTTQYTDRDTLLLSILILTISVILIAALALSLAGIINWKITLVAFAIKTITDSLYLAAGSKFFGIYKELFFLPLFQLLYPLYISYAALAGCFNQFHWKGRQSLNQT